MLADILNDENKINTASPVSAFISIHVAWEALSAYTSPLPTQLYWDIIDNYITLCMFKVYNVLICYTSYCKMITTVVLANTSITTAMSLPYANVEPAQFFFSDDFNACWLSPKNVQ